MGNTTATESTHRGLKIFLAFVLTFSLLSVAVIEEISAAFADEPESSIEQPQFDTTNKMILMKMMLWSPASSIKMRCSIHHLKTTIP